MEEMVVLSEKLLRLSKSRFAISDFDLLWRRGEERGEREEPSGNYSQVTHSVQAYGGVVLCGSVVHTSLKLNPNIQLKMINCSLIYTLDFKESFLREFYPASFQNRAK